MYDVHATHWAACQTNYAYLLRYDTRPPHVIKKVGFEGTPRASCHAFASFGNRTVVAAGSIEGALCFKQECDPLPPDDNDKGHYFLYKINAKNLRVYSFLKNSVFEYIYLKKVCNSPISFEDYYNSFINRLSNIEMERSHNLPAEISKEMIFDHLHHCIKIMSEADEVHIQGPVHPSLITHVRDDDPPIGSGSVSMRQVNHKRSNSVS